MQQRVRIRLRTVRRVVGDKTLEIPDSLNGARHDKQEALDAPFGLEFTPVRRALVMLRLGLFGNRKYRAKI